MQTVKMVVTGPFNAGKTEFIRSVSEIEVVSTERKISSESERVKDQTTVAMDFGRISIDENLVLYLFGTPGQRRFDFMWEILSEGMLGFIVMVDSSRPETFREARTILETFRAYAPTPYVVAANKQDDKDAWEIDDIRIALRLSPQVKLLPCVAKDKEAVKNVLLELLYSILEEMEIAPSVTTLEMGKDNLARIIVADHDREFRDLAIFALRFAGHEAVGASDGEECRSLAERTKPDLILMDDNLPRMDVDTGLVRVVLMHSPDQALETHPDDAERGEEIIIKPSDIDQLVRQVNKLLKKRNPPGALSVSKT